MSVIDLHAHTTRSDGKESVSEVFEHAAAAGVNVLAITDHDTTSGWIEAIAASENTGVGFVPGIEVTTRAQVGNGERARSISVHLLAYLPDPNHEGLLSTMGESVMSREARAIAMVEALGKDFEITWDDVLAELEHGATIGRPAIADAMIKLRVVTDRTEAFEGVLSKHGGYYIPTDVVDTIDAIKLVLDAGGVPVIAHPLTGLKPDASRSDLPLQHFESLIAAGLAGFEVFHREVPENARAWLLDLAKQHDLIVTGSSDYHGVLGKPNRLGENSTDPEMLERIIAQSSGTSAFL